MPLRNRVTPFNALEAVADRGTLMGNRGILHDADKREGASTWKHKRWLACVLLFKDRKRQLMVPGEYTALFFLDEAVSLAAGHRPCRECRRAAFEEFVAAWRKADGIATDMKVGADEIDAALHASRVAPGRKQARFVSDLGALPDGAMFAYPAEPRDAWLLWKGAAHRWSHAGYFERRAPHSILVDVITSLRTVETLRAGYRPTVHASASTN